MDNMILKNGVYRPRGIITMDVFKYGKLINRLRYQNLFVDAGLPALAALLGGAGTGYDVTAVGFGTGSAAPTTGDTTLTGGYYKAIDSATEDSLGSVTFNWTLTYSGDAGADGMVIQEMGLFANHAAVGLPGASAPAPMCARRVIASLTLSSGVNVTGTWTLTF